ncbi:MAG TPA: transcriptional regulator, partial [Lachnospiraceae bacterium]|nr:transcriptional regulator [Lachnospiraceae bacterium]
VLLACLILGSTELPKRLAERLLRHVEGSSVLTLVLRIGFYLGVFLLSVAYLVGASYNPFLYFRF